MLRVADLQLALCLSKKIHVLCWGWGRGVGWGRVRGAVGGCDGVGVRGILIYLEYLCIILHSLQIALYLPKEILILLICWGGEWVGVGGEWVGWGGEWVGVEWLGGGSGVY